MNKRTLGNTFGQENTWGYIQTREHWGLGYIQTRFTWADIGLETLDLLGLFKALSVETLTESCLCAEAINEFDEVVTKTGTKQKCI